MADISVIKLPNGNSYNLKDTTARSMANSAVPNTRTVNGKALSSDISLGAGDVGAYTKKETNTKISAAIASTYKYKGSVTADKLPTSGQVVGDVYNITNDSSYGKAGMNVAWNGTTWDALGSNVDLSNYVTTSDSRLSNARPASDVHDWAKAAKKPSYSASEIGAAPASHTHTKDQVGLANVANLDQSKAIKSITRSGTTFTATALDGTKTTFTQQDNNTTYSVATSSTDGLMSKSDKAKLDGIGTGSNVKSVNGKTGAVTLAKGDVGLGNVANLDQSKAIKSITRSGTTFTATALDGTTTTFTQQDNNTTYGLASQSSNGLMSAADKSKLDGIGAGSNVKSVNGKTGVVNLSKADVGLGNVDNTSDADKHVYANNLKWGGVNIANDISPLDVATSNLFAGNIMAYSKPAGITVEYSTDGGTTWADYGADDKSKIRLVTPEVGGVNYYLGKKNTAQVATMDLLRIELDARKMGIYCNPKNLLINISTNGGTGSYVNIEYSTRASDTVFHNFGKYNISGWSGWNSIPINNIPSGAFGTNGRNDQTVILRLTFGFTGFSKGWETKTSFSVCTMSMIASNRWGAPSEMARVNSIYHLDEYQNATFPAKVTATSFAGATATSSADGLMSKSDKSKLDGIGAGSNVKSVNSKTGAVTLTKSDIGLSNVDNTADSAKSVKYATSAGSANSVAWGNVSGKPSTYPPSSHTHTPAQVGLGNVANLDQSKAIKSITRSGTTFTATALDGTTTTFTQQDNNTTYSVATSSTDGLMSKSDKAKLDGIGTGSNVKSVNGKTGAVTLAKGDVGLSNVDNTADSAKSVKYAASAGSAGSADTVDGVHEYSFLRYRDATSTDGTETLWNQIGIREYDNALPSGLSGLYSYGAVVSLPSGNVRFDLYYNHQASSNGDGLYYRTGWRTDKKGWAHLIDSQSISSQSVNYANSAGSVAWSNVSGKPSSLPANGGNAATVNGHSVNANVPSGAKFTDTTYAAATQSSPGLMSAADKKKLDSYTTGSAGGVVEVTLAAASWSSSTTEINGNNYYTYSVSVANIGNPHPQIFCSGGNSVIPSATQESEFNHIRYALVDTAKSTVTFYSIEKPSVAINVVIKDYLESSIVSGTVSVTIATSDWSSTTSTVNGRAFYTAKKTLSSVSSNYPTIICGTADTLPSDAEQAAFDCINYAAADTSTKTVTFYAIQKPTSAVVAIII